MNVQKAVHSQVVKLLVTEMKVSQKTYIETWIQNFQQITFIRLPMETFQKVILRMNF